MQSDMKHWPFKVINDAGKPKLRVEFKGEEKTFYPEEISSMVLLKMKETAEAYLGKVCGWEWGGGEEGEGKVFEWLLHLVLLVEP